MGEAETWRRWGLEGFMRREHQPQGGPEAWIEVTRKVVSMLHGPASDRNQTLEALRAIDRPTLLIAGDRDPVVPLEEVIAMYRAPPQASLWIVPNATHFLGNAPIPGDAPRSSVRCCASSRAASRGRRDPSAAPPPPRAAPDESARIRSGSCRLLLGIREERDVVQRVEGTRKAGGEVLLEHVRRRRSAAALVAVP
ncbi:MAG: alpha/beta hydrolase [Candidatus Eisenbacteria bacterium]